MKTTAPTATHYPIDGLLFVRVTEFLRSVGAASDFSGIPEEDRQFFLDRGTANHDAWAKVEDGTADQYEFDPRVKAYLPAHAKFLKETGFRALPGGIELRVKATWKDLGFDRKTEEAGIAGTLDRIGTIQNRVVLLDYKTTTVTPSTRLQVALYILMIPGYKFGEVERYGVAIKCDGSYSMSPRYPFSDKAEVLGLISKYLMERK